MKYYINIKYRHILQMDRVVYIIILCGVIVMVLMYWILWKKSETFVVSESVPNTFPTAMIPSDLKNQAQYPVRYTERTNDMTRQQIGDRWKESWRPYFWRNYPMQPCFTPAPNQPSNMMDQLVSRHAGLFPQVECPYVNKVDKCVQYANSECRHRDNPDFCFRRTYGKCLVCQI